MVEKFKTIIEKYNALAGSTITESILVAKKRAKEKDCVVLLRFNDVDVFVDGQADCDFLEKYYIYRVYIARYENVLNY